MIYNNNEKELLCAIENIIKKIGEANNSLCMNTELFIESNRILSEELFQIMSSFMPEYVKDIVITNIENSIRLSNNSKYFSNIFYDLNNKIQTMWSNFRYMLDKIEYIGKLSESITDLRRYIYEAERILIDTFDLLSYENAKMAINAYDEIDVYEYRTFLEYSNWQGYNLKLEENINYLIDLYIYL